MPTPDLRFPLVFLRAFVPYHGHGKSLLLTLKHQGPGQRRDEGAGSERGAARGHASKHGEPGKGGGGAEEKRHYLEERVWKWLVEVCRPSGREAAKLHVTLLPAPPKSRPPISSPTAKGSPHLALASPANVPPSAQSGTIYSAAGCAELRAVMPTRKLAMRAVAASYMHPLLVADTPPCSADPGGSGHQEEKQLSGDARVGEFVLDVGFEELPVQPVRGRVLLAGLKQDVPQDLVPGIFGALASFVSPGGVEVCWAGKRKIGEKRASANTERAR